MEKENQENADAFRSAYVAVFFIMNTSRFNVVSSNVGNVSFHEYYAMFPLH